MKGILYPNCLTIENNRIQQWDTMDIIIDMTVAIQTFREKLKLENLSNEENVVFREISIRLRFKHKTRLFL
jgi:3-methyladenine DNA glycosylase AlkD